MRIRLLALAALAALIPATAPALSLDSVEFNDGTGFKAFTSCPNGVCDLALGTHSNIVIRINQNQAGDSMSAYVVNVQGTAGGLEALPFSDLFDSDGDLVGDTPVDVTCKVRATADSNCGANFLGPLPPGSRPNNNVIFGVAEIFAADVTADITVFSRLDLNAITPGATMLLASSSSLVTPGGEIGIGGIGFRVIPEPGTVLLLGAGLAGLALQGRKRA
jgi:hypothetical protein